MLEALGEIEQFAAEVRRRRHPATSCCSAWAAPRWRRRCCAARFAPAARTGRACTCSTRPTPATIRAVQDAVDLERTLFLVSSKSGGTIEPLSLFAHFFSLVADGGSFVAITDPGSGLAAARAGSTASADVPRRPGHRRALQRAVAVRDRPGGADRDRRARAAGGRRRARGRPGVDDQTRSVRRRSARRLLARRRPQRARRGRARQAHVRDRRRRCPGSGCGSSSWWPSRPASTARGILPVAEEPLGRAGATTARTASSRTCLTSPSPSRELDDRVQALARRGAPADHDPDPRPARPRPRVPARRARRRGRRLGAGDQPLRPAQRAAGEGRHQARARRATKPTTSCPRSPTPTRPRCARCCSAPRRRTTSRSWPTREPSTRVRRGRRRAARGDPRSRRRRRRRSATAPASCTRPASSTRAARRSGASCS